MIWWGSIDHTRIQGVVSTQVGVHCMMMLCEYVTWHCEYVSMTTDDPRCVTVLHWFLAVQAPLHWNQLHRSNAIRTQSEGLEQCNEVPSWCYTHGSWGMVKPLQYMLIFIYLSIMLLRSNQHSVSKHYQWFKEISRIFHIREPWEI